MKRVPGSIPGCLLLIVCGFALASCAPAVRPPSSQSNLTPFRPPVSVGDSRSTTQAGPTATSQPAQPTAPSAAPVTCDDQLRFVDDLTIPDGAQVAPEATLDKRWLIENNSNCDWGEAYRVRLVAGPDLGAPTEQALYPARSGSQATLRMVFKAPAGPGSYRSAWQAFNPRGEPFGDLFFIDIVVE